MGNAHILAVASHNSSTGSFRGQENCTEKSAFSNPKLSKLGDKRTKGRKGSKGGDVELDSIPEHVHLLSRSNSSFSTDEGSFDYSDSLDETIQSRRGIAA